MRTRWTIAALLVVAWTVSGAAQDSPPVDTQTGKPATTAPQEKPATAKKPQESAALVPVKVTVVLSRHRGDKKISSLSDAHTPDPSFKSVTPQTSYSYRKVGTNIDCDASTAAPGLFRLHVTVVDTSAVHLDPSGTKADADMPAIRTLNSSFTILLRDGQRTEYTSATDPVSGEVMKIDLTLNVLK